MKFTYLLLLAISQAKTKTEETPELSEKADPRIIEEMDFVSLLNDAEDFDAEWDRIQELLGNNKKVPTTWDQISHYWDLILQCISDWYWDISTYVSDKLEL